MIKTLKVVGILLLVSVMLVVGGFYVYTLDYYRAMPQVDKLIEDHSERLDVDGRVTTVLPPDLSTSEVGLIFYPGGKVEAKAYLPLLLQVADYGITTYLVEMPFNLAVFDTKAGLQVIEDHPEVYKWYIMGHSLGGAMASAHMDKAGDRYEGLILLGAYPIHDAAVNNVAIYGTHDIMLDLDKVNKANQVYEIIDGNHAYFGDYGQQEGDGKALISRRSQQEQAVDLIVNFIYE